MIKIKKLLLFVTLMFLLSCNNNKPGGGAPRSTRENQDSVTNDSTIISGGDEPRRIDDPACTPNPNGRILSMTLRAQEAKLWCWAACGEMIMEKLGATIFQCDEANQNFGRTDCCDSPTPGACDRGGWPEFKKYGFEADTTHSAALTWEEVKKQIDCMKTPFCATWKWDEGGGHMMVISAYKIESGINYVKLRNPLPVGIGASRWIRYTDYVSGWGYTHWDDFYNIRRNR